ARGGMHGRVELALLGLELDVEHHVAARGQLGRDDALEPSQHEGPSFFAQNSELRAIALFDGKREALPKVAAPAEQTAIGKMHQAPELLEPVFEGRARERQPEVRGQLVRGTGHLAVWI